MIIKHSIIFDEELELMLIQITFKLNGDTCAKKVGKHKSPFLVALPRLAVILYLLLSCLTPQCLTVTFKTLTCSDPEKIGHYHWVDPMWKVNYFNYTRETGDGKFGLVDKNDGHWTMKNSLTYLARGVCGRASK